MKRCKKFFSLFFAAALFLTLSFGNVNAAEEYTYTVTFYSGNQGSFREDAAMIIESSSASVEKVWIRL